MRVFIDGYIFWVQRKGGISRYWSQLLSKMAEMSGGSQFYLYLRPYSVNELPEHSNLKLLEAKTSLPAGVYKRVEKSLISWQIWRNRPDVFHSTYYTRTNALEIPNVVTVYDATYELFPHCFPPRIDHLFDKKREVILSADKIVAISQSTKRDLISVYGLPEEKMKVIYPGIDTAVFRPVENDGLKRDFRERYGLSRPYFLHVGLRRGYKNFSTLLRAFGESPLKEDYMLLAVGGESELLPEENRIMERGGLSECVKLVGPVSTDDLVLAYSSAYAFVTPSLHEGFGLTVLEAMACGCPTLASNSSSLPEAVGDAGILFDSENVDDLMSALEETTNPEARAQLVENGLKRVNHFRWEKAAAQMLATYQEVTDGA